jgi:mannose-1-phosphate guanylyltransferase/mannose-6-phosphate isomerase
MKIRPVILCGGEGVRLWPKSKNNQAKQFIDFGGWTLFEKTLERVKNTIFDYPIISTNQKYLKQIKFYLKKNKIKKYKIILEPLKKNTAPAILASTLSMLQHNEWEQPLIFLSSDHLIEKKHVFYNEIKKNTKKLNNENIFIFGVKPTFPSTEYGYFLTKKIKNNTAKVSKFIEKPSYLNAKKAIKKKAYWNTGMFFLKTQSVISNFMKHSPKIYSTTIKALSAASKTKIRNNICYIDKNLFKKIPAKSFDYAILQKTKNINAIKLNIPWNDLGNWKEILKIYHKNKSKYFKKKNVYYRPWGSYVNLFEGKNFLVKELTINSKSSISLQKHHCRSEHWMITQGKPRITLKKKKFFKKENDSIFIPVGTIHRIENLYNKAVKIMEVQTGPVLKESDIVRYKDVYGRVR